MSTNRELKEAIESALNEVLIYNDLPLGKASVTRHTPYVTDGKGNYTAASGSAAFDPSDVTKEAFALYEASLDSSEPTDPGDDDGDDHPIPPPDKEPDPPPMSGEGNGTHPVIATVTDGIGRMWYGQAMVGDDPNVAGIYKKLISKDGTEHPRLTGKFYADCCEISNQRADSQYDDINCKLQVTYDGEKVAIPASSKKDGTVDFWRGCAMPAIRYGKQVGWDVSKIDASLVPNYSQDPGSFNASGCDLTFNGGGVCGYTTHMSTTGERDDIGPFPTWDVAFMTDPTEATWKVVRDAADYDGLWPVFFCDPDTGHILNVEKEAAVGANILPVAQGGYKFNNNPIAKYLGKMNGDSPGPTPNVWRISACPNRPNGAHLTRYAMLAAMVTGTARDRDHASFWGNWPLLEINPVYRQTGGVALGSERRFAWCLYTLFLAGYVSSDQAYFQRRTARQLEIVQKNEPLNNLGVWSENHVHTSDKVPGYTASSIWMQGYLMMVLGVIGRKLPEWKDLAHYVGKFYINLIVNHLWGPFITIYSWFDFDGNNQWIPKLEDQLRVTLQSDGYSEDQINAIVSATTMDAIHAVMKEHRPNWEGKCIDGVCDFHGAISADDSYPANAIAAIASAYSVGVTDADKAWDYCKALPTKPVYGSNQKYHIVPNVA